MLAAFVCGASAQFHGGSTMMGYAPAGAFDQAAPHDFAATAGSWTGIRSAIPSGGGAVTVTITQPFTCDYGSQIDIPSFTNVTIIGNNVEVDAAQKGRFFNVSAGAVLTLDSLTLRNGAASSGGAIYLHSAATVNSYGTLFDSNAAERVRPPDITVLPWS
jgi:hypothetical protein